MDALTDDTVIVIEHSFINLVNNQTNKERHI